MFKDKILQEVSKEWKHWNIEQAIEINKKSEEEVKKELAQMYLGLYQE